MRTPFVSQKKSIKNIKYLNVAKYLLKFKGVILSVIIPISRRRIATLFSQRWNQFMIRRNYAKSFLGFKRRILAKITALTTIKYLNKFLLDRN